jgi:hypothetical protein
MYPLCYDIQLNVVFSGCYSGIQGLWYRIDNCRCYSRTQGWSYVWGSIFYSQALSSRLSALVNDYLRRKNTPGKRHEGCPRFSCNLHSSSSNARSDASFRRGVASFGADFRISDGHSDSGIFKFSNAAHREASDSLYAVKES